MAFFVGLVGLVAASLLGCSQPPPLRQNWQRNQGVEALLQLQQRQFDGLDDLRAEARVSLNQAGKKQQATASVLYKRPDRLRLEVRGPLFSHIFTALLKGDTLTIRDASGTYRGPVHGPFLRDLTGIDLGAYDLRYGILGLVEPGLIGPLEAQENPRADRGVFSLSGPGGTRRVWVDLFAGFFLREELTVEDSPWPVERHLDDYRLVGGIFLPAKVVFRQGEMAFSLEYKSYGINVGLADKIFDQGLPQRGIIRF